MEIKKLQINNNEVIIKLNGRIDSSNANEFDEVLQAINYNEKLLLTIDCKGLTYITSAGLRAILIARKKLKKEQVIITNVNDEVMEIFGITGFLDYFTFLKDDDHIKVVIDNNKGNADYVNNNVDFKT